MRKYLITAILLTLASPAMAANPEFRVSSRKVADHSFVLQIQNTGGDMAIVNSIELNGGTQFSCGESCHRPCIESPLVLPYSLAVGSQILLTDLCTPLRLRIRTNQGDAEYWFNKPDMTTRAPHFVVSMDVRGKAINPYYVLHFQYADDEPMTINDIVINKNNESCSLPAHMPQQTHWQFGRESEMDFGFCKPFQIEFFTDRGKATYRIDE